MKSHGDFVTLCLATVLRPYRSVRVNIVLGVWRIAIARKQSQLITMHSLDKGCAITQVAKWDY